jgi:hypothetical protein
VDDFHKELLLKEFQSISNEPVARILPGNSIFTYHRKAIQRIVYDMLPNTESLSIYPPTFHTLTIKVIAYKPMFRKEGVQAITSDGVVYKEINDISKLPSIKTASSSSILSENILHLIESIYSKVDASLFTVGSILVDENNDIHIKSKEHESQVIFSSTDAAGIIWSNIVSAIDTEPLKSKLATEKEALLYLDVRFGNKVFYRFTNDKDTAIIHPTYATTTATTTTH